MPPIGKHPILTEIAFLRGYVKDRNVIFIFHVIAIFDIDKVSISSMKNCMAESPGRARKIHP